MEFSLRGKCDEKNICFNSSCNVSFFIIAVGIAVLIGTNVLYVAMGKEGVLVALLGGAAILGILLLVIDRVKRK